MRPILLAVRFLLELALLGALAFWGFTLDQGLLVRVLAGIGAPAMAIAVWARWVAPKSPRQLDDPPRFLIELALFAVAAVGLYVAGQPVLAIVLISVYLLDRLALTATGGTGL